MAKLFIISLLLANCLNFLCPAHAVNVLALLPSVWKSHYLFGRRLLQQLVVQHNHTVTLISPHAVSEYSPLGHMREIRIEGLFENWLEMGLSFNMEHMRQKSTMERFTRLIYAGTTNIDLLLGDTEVRKLLLAGERFDLLFVDLFLGDSLLGISYYYQMPTVAISPNGANSWLNQMFGNPQSSALDPSNFLPYVERMDIWQRCMNTLMGLFEKLTYNFFHTISQQAVYQKHFESLCQLAKRDLPHHRELTKNVSLMLINSHPVVQYPRAYLPNMLEIAGAHLDAKQHLPAHLREYIDRASNGVIYLSFGANALTADLAREKLETLLDVFAYLKDMRVLLKWELETFDAVLPENVLWSEWFPQEAILAHPNVKVFISSCGLMSVVESINGLTPILAIPIYPDQEATASRLRTQGVSLTVPFDHIVYDSLLNAIQQLSQNSSYHEQIQQLRKLLWSSYGTPLAKSLHYIELILKTAGGVHLKSHANEFNFLRLGLVDVIVIIVLGLCCILAVPFLVTCCILRRSYYNQAQAFNYRVQMNACVSAGNLTGAAGEPASSRRRTSTSTSASSNSSTSSGSPKYAKQRREVYERSVQASQKLD